MAAFVKTGEDSWSNLGRASGIEVRPSRFERDHWIVVAHFSGSHPVIRDGFPSAEAARTWVADLLERSL